MSLLLAQMRTAARTEQYPLPLSGVTQKTLLTPSSSQFDAVDGSSTGTSVPWMWALLRLSRFRGASHTDDNDNRLSIAKSVFQVHGAAR